ncbi:MAG: NTP transferase domain-containing protein [Spirochaetota bacterium]
MIDIPNMLLIGASGRNAGKTELACKIISQFAAAYSITGIKVTTIREGESHCPRGQEGCGICGSISGNFDIIEETGRRNEKDTARLLKAGAKKVYWLKVKSSFLEAGIRTLIESEEPGTLFLCESNSLRTVVVPGVFLQISGGQSGGKKAEIKASARRVAGYADRILKNCTPEIDEVLNVLSIANGAWILKEKAGVIILAGGKSNRMGMDKCLLPIKGFPMIEYIYRRLEPHFSEVLVSTNDETRFPFLKARFCTDMMDGAGPLAGIASGLAASEYEVNAVVACDMPDIDIRFIKEMIRKSEGFDGVVPVDEKNRIEPAYAVYRKTMLNAMQAALDSGRRRIKAALDVSRIHYVFLKNKDWVRNINTQEDYENYIKLQK